MLAYNIILKGARLIERFGILLKANLICGKLASLCLGLSPQTHRIMLPSVWLAPLVWSLVCAAILWSVKLLPKCSPEMTYKFDIPIETNRTRNTMKKNNLPQNEWATWEESNILLQRIQWTITTKTESYQRWVQESARTKSMVISWQIVSRVDR